MATPETKLDVWDLVRLFDQTAKLAGSVSRADACMARALDLVCAFTGWPLGHVYLIDLEATALRPTDIWHADDAGRVSPFVEATARTPMPAGAGLPGRVLAA